MRSGFLGYGGAFIASLVAAISCARGGGGAAPESVGQGVSALVSGPFELADRALGPSNDKPQVLEATYGAGMFAVLAADGGSFALRRVSATTGQSLDPLGISAGSGEDADVAFDGTSFRVFTVEHSVKGLETVAIAPDGSIARVYAPVMAIPNAVVVRAACARDGTCLVVVDDFQHLLALRVDAQGKAIDAAPFAVAVADASVRPRVVAVGGGFSIFWPETLAQPNAHKFAVRARRIDGNGALQPTVTLAEVGTELGAGVGFEPLSVAYAGSVGLVAWNLEDNTHSTRTPQALRVGADLSVLDAAPIALDANMVSEISVVAAGGGFDLYSLTYPDETRRHVDTSGNVSAPTTLSWPVKLEEHLAAASDGTREIAFASAGDVPNSWGIYAQILDGGGSVVTAADEVTGALAYNGPPVVAWGGARYTAIWADRRKASGVYASRVAADGSTVSSPAFRVGDYEVDQLALAANAHGALAIWRRAETNADGMNGNEAAFIAPDDSVSPPFIVAPGYSARAPALATDGTDYLAVWNDSKNFVSDLYFARISGSGALIDTTALKLTTVSQTIYEVDPVVVWTGTSYLVAWSQLLGPNSYDVYGARISPAGAILSGPTSLAGGMTGSYQLDVNLACSPSVCALVWDPGGPVARRLDLDGNPIDAPTMMPQGKGAGFALAWDGQAFVLTCSTSVGNGYRDVMARWMAPYGTWLGSDFTTIATNAVRYDDPPSIAGGGGGRSLVGYRRAKEVRAYGQLLTNDGVPDGGAPDASEAGPAVDAGIDASGVDGAANGASDASDTKDANEPDAGIDDASVPPDAHADTGVPGSNDAAPTVNADPGEGATLPSATDAGCGCRSAGGGSTHGGALVMLAVALALGRRRARSVSA